MVPGVGQQRGGGLVMRTGEGGQRALEQAVGQGVGTAGADAGWGAEGERYGMCATGRREIEQHPVARTSPPAPAAAARSGARCRPVRVAAGEGEEAIGMARVGLGGECHGVCAEGVVHGCGDLFQSLGRRLAERQILAGGPSDVPGMDGGVEGGSRDRLSGVDHRPSSVGRPAVGPGTVHSVRSGTSEWPRACLAGAEKGFRVRTVVFPSPRSRTTANSDSGPSPPAVSPPTSGASGTMPLRLPVGRARRCGFTVIFIRRMSSSRTEPSPA